MIFYSVQIGLGFGFIACLITKEHVGSTILGISMLMVTIINFIKESKDDK